MTGFPERGAGRACGPARIRARAPSDAAESSQGLRGSPTKGRRQFAEPPPQRAGGWQRRRPRNFSLRPGLRPVPAPHARLRLARAPAGPAVPAPGRGARRRGGWRQAERLDTYARSLMEHTTEAKSTEARASPGLDRLIEAERDRGGADRRHDSAVPTAVHGASARGPAPGGQGNSLRSVQTDREEVRQRDEHGTGCDHAGVGNCAQLTRPRASSTTETHDPDDIVPGSDARHPGRLPRARRRVRGRLRHGRGQGRR